MNSMSRRYQEEYRRDCEKDYRRDYRKDHDKEEEKCPTIIKCGCPSSITIPESAEAGDIFTLASLTLDTSCLCDPIIKLEFASNIVITAGTSGAFTVQIFKQCKNQINPVPVGPAWAWNPGGANSVESETFSFFICDSDLCDDDCCTYIARATITTDVGNNSINVNNATLGAIATCKSNACPRRCRRKDDEKYYY